VGGWKKKRPRPGRSQGGRVQKKKRLSWRARGRAGEMAGGCEMISQAGECKNKRSRPTGKVVFLATVGGPGPERMDKSAVKN